MNRSRFASPGASLGSSPHRRILAVALVLATLLTVAGIAAVLTGRAEQQHTTHTPAGPARPAPSKSVPTEPASGTDAVPAPPQIAEPVAFAEAAARMLWSYDTRTTNRDEQLASMHAWMTPETRYADWSAVTGQVPDPVLWSRMADNAQHATAKVTEGHYPSAFKQALADDPAALTTAYIYAVTVTGTQTIVWKDGRGAEERSLTLAVQCRPSADCTLVSVAPQVSP
ncbi:hypothetical protein [Streptomyces sp. SID1121]|uniref:hypothetical protein n=1 Tax=Streptomyces sp. SID1121 TaxID=3425888 RepID=UPI004055D3AA